MEVSPKTLREVEFREKMRGYHPEDVDQFLEKVAAGIEVLQDRLRQALERVQRAEQAAADAGGNDEALRRTLVLAQRTADLAVQEAREQAARVLAGAEQQAQGIIAEAEDRARRAHEDALIEVRAEVSKLESARQQLQAEVDSLSRWVEDNRSHLSLALQEALARVDRADLLSPAPISRGVDLPPSRPTPGSPAPPAQPPVARSMPQPPAEMSRPPRPAAPPPSRLPQGEGPATAAWSPGDETKAAELPGRNEGDQYFADLRRAVDEEHPLGPRDDEDPPPPQDEDADEFYDQDFADARRFGGRLRRKR